MKIIFVYPAISTCGGFYSFYNSPNCDTHYISHGISSISSNLKKHGFTDIELLDFRRLQSWKDYKNKIIEKEFDIAIFSYLSPDYQIGAEAIKIMKGAKPKAKVILGGLHASVTENDNETQADMIIKGEGEDILVDLARQNFPNYGRVIKAEPVKDIDSLPFVDRELFVSGCELNYPIFDGLKCPHITIVAGRGCPYNCITGDTPINTIFGKIQIKELAEKYKTIPVYTYDKNSQKVIISDAINIAKTGINKKILRIEFDDNTHIDCTPDHKFLTFSWGNQFKKTNEYEIEAKDLEPNMRVRALKEESHFKYERMIISWGRKKYKYRSRLVMEYLLKRKLNHNEQVHHKDKNKLNDLPHNLILCKNQKEHISIFHPEISERMKKDNPVKYLTKESREKIANQTRGLKRTKEQKLKYALSKIGSKNPNWKNKTPVGFRSKYKNELQQYFKEINHKIKRVYELKERQDVYCLEVPETGWFFANNVLIHNCKFCVDRKKIYGATCRIRSVANIIEELEELDKKYQWNSLMIHDDILYNRNWLQEFIVEYGKRFFNRKFWIQTRADFVAKNEDVMKELADVGLLWVGLGWESFSQKILDFIDKKTTVEQNFKSAEICKKYGIRIFANYILGGFPNETEEDIKATAEAMIKIRPERHSRSIYTAFPGSWLYDYCKQNDLITNENWGNHSVWEKKIKSVDYQLINKYGQYIDRNCYG